MERKVTKLEHSHVEVLVTVDTNTWREAQEKEINKLAKTVKVDGFRPGKAPLEQAKKHIDPMKVLDGAIDSLLPSLYDEVLKEEDLKPYAQPHVDVTKISDTELEIKFVIVTAPEVELGQYKGLKVGKEKSEVSKEEVEESIDLLRAQSASLTLKDDAAAMGDTVVMDFEGFVDGKAFDGGKSENHELELGSHQFIPGFEEQLVGHKANEEFEIEVTFPENYVESLKGKKATFKIKLHEVKQKLLPELNDDLVKELEIADVHTVEELRAFKEAELKERKENESKRVYINKIIDEIAKNSKIDIPHEIIDSQMDHTMRQMQQRLQQSGLTLEQYLSIVGQTEEQYREQIHENAHREASNYFILEAIVKKEALVVTDEDMEKEYASLAKQYAMTVEAVKTALANNLDEWKNNVLFNKAEDFLYENND